MTDAIASTWTPADGQLGQLDLLDTRVLGPVANVRPVRLAKRNATSDRLIQQLHTATQRGPIAVARPVHGIADGGGGGERA